jgi:peroxiredoxin
MANFYGARQYYNDTAYVNSKGEFEFNGKEEMKPKGIYSVIMPDKKSYLQVVIAENSFYIEADKNDLMNSVKIKNSPENEAFYDYMRKMNSIQPKIQSLTKQKENEKNKKKIKKIQEQIDEKANELKEYRKNFVEDNKDLFIAKVMKASIEPEIPDSLEDGSKEQYIYYKKHYFDNIDMKDDGMIRTPILHQKIDYYLQNVVTQYPDSICAAAKRMTDMTGNDSNLIYKYIVQHVTNTYEKSKIMGMDGVFVCMAEQYYMKDKAFWIDSTQYAELEESYTKRRRQIIGVTAENIILPDTGGTWHSMYDIKAPYTVLVFWDPNCGHCKKELPKLQKFYEEHKDNGVEIFGVSTGLENKDLKKFLKKKNITFLNVSDTPEINENAVKYIRAGKTTLNSLNFRDYWDIFSTPQIYLLDENKEIIAKRIASQQLPDIINSHRENESINIKAKGQTR